MLSAFQKTKRVASLTPLCGNRRMILDWTTGGAHAPRVPFPAPSLETSGECVLRGVEHDSRGGCAPHSTIRNPNSAGATGGRVASRKAGRKETHFLNSFWDGRLGGAHAPRVRFPAPSLETPGNVFDEGVEHDSRGGCAPYSNVAASRQLMPKIDYPWCYLFLGRRCEITPTNQKKLKRLRYRKAAEQNYAMAQYNLGVCYVNGQGVVKDEVEAVKWYRKAAEQNLPDAQFYLGVCYANGQGVAKDEVEAVKWYRKAAEQNYAMAQCNLSLCYANGQGVVKDEVEALKWSRKSAEQGNATGQLFLGSFYNDGLGVAQNYAEAAKWYRKAADQGDAQAEFFLATYYALGKGVETNEVEALKWCRKAAEQNLKDAQFTLGSTYFNGVGVPKDLQEALKWYRRAAEQGYVDSQFYLGKMYSNGMGVETNYDEATKWFRMAAEQGNTNAQLCLVWIYIHGVGVPKVTWNRSTGLTKQQTKGYRMLNMRSAFFI
jgi:hypothetical protein